LVEPPIGIEPMTYALRAGSRALLAGSNLVPASGSQVAAVGDCWLLTVVRGHLGDMPGAGHVGLTVMRWVPLCDQARSGHELHR